MKLVALFFLATLSSLLEYRFGRDFGEYYFDYSGGSNHGISVGAVRTDRGIYLKYSTGNHVMTQNPFVLTQSFYISSWIMVNNFDISLISKVSDSTCTYISAYLNKELKMPSTEYLYTMSTISASLNSWFLFSLYYSSDLFQMYFNKFEVLAINLAWTDISGYLYIGSTSSNQVTAGVFIWNLIINFSLPNFENYIQEISTNCLTGEGSCNSCSISTVDIYLGVGCLSVVSDPNFNSYNLKCDDSLYGCSRNVVFNCSKNTVACFYSISSNLCYEKDLTFGAEKVIDCQCRNGYRKYNQGSCICDYKYYGNPVTQTCKSCEPACKECDDSKCIVCIDNTLARLSDKTCLCNEGYYMDSDYQCKKCENTCKDCTKSNCIKCLSDNTIIESNYCKCVASYYMDSNYICKSCESTCLTCDINKCLTCWSVNTKIIDKYCECNEGYYMDSDYQCKKCDETCKDCTMSSCNICLSDNTIIESNYCICEASYYMDSKSYCKSCDSTCLTCDQSNCFACRSEHTNIIDNYCKCKEGYYMDYDYNCKKCHRTCLTCTDTLCKNCVYDKTHVKDNYCECNDGYFSDGSIVSSDSCKPCLDECSFCDNINSCTDCITLNAKLNKNKRCECFEGFYNETYLTSINSCKPCDSLCKTCDYAGCLTCADALSRVNLQRKCQRYYFYGNILLNSQNKVQLCFTEALKAMLDKEDIEMKLDSKEAIYFLKVLNSSCLLLSTIINDETVQHFIEIKINETEVLSQKNSILLSYTFEIYTSIIVNKDLVITILKSKAATQTASTSVAGISLVSNPLALWSLLNTIQLFTFMPLNSVPYPEKFKKITISLLNYNIVPNLLEYFIDPNTTSEPYKEAIDIGITTSVVLLNCGKLWVVFSILILIKFCLSVLSLIFEGWDKIELMEKKWSYQTFLRFFVEFYLELIIYSFIELRTVKNI